MPGESNNKTELVEKISQQGSDLENLNQEDSDLEVADLKKRVSWLEDLVRSPILTSVPSHITEESKFIIYKDTTNGIYRLYARVNSDWRLIGSTQFLPFVITSGAQGDIFYYNGTNWVNLGPGTNRYILQTGGASANPSWAPSPQSVLTAQGDILYASAANTLARLAPGTSGQFLKTQGVSANPTWASLMAWERAGETTLGALADTITVSITTASTRYLVIWDVESSTVADDNLSIQFNADSAGNYAARRSENGGAEATDASSGGIAVGRLQTSNRRMAGFAFVTAPTTKEKIVMGQSAGESADGAANIPDKWEFVGKWANTVDTITSIRLNSGRNMVSGSMLSVYQIANP